MTLPSHLSETTFRLYEPHLTRAVLSWPKETPFPKETWVDLAGVQLSGNTFVARFRDSIATFLRNKWTSTVDLVKLQSMTGEYCVAFDKDGVIYFRARGRKGRPSQHTTEVRDSLAASIDAHFDKKPWKDVTYEEARALAILLAGGRLSGPIIVDGIFGKDTSWPKELEDDFGIGVTHDEVNNKTVFT